MGEKSTVTAVGNPYATPRVGIWMVTALQRVLEDVPKKIKRLLVENIK